MKAEMRKLLTPQGVRQVAARWPDAGETELIDDVTNVVFAFQCQGQPRILRLTHCSQRSQPDIEAELDWVRFLAQNDVPVARPIASRNGTFSEILPVGGSYFVAAVFERAAGEMVDPASAEQWNPDLIRSVGRLMGRMHAVTKRYDARHLTRPRRPWQDTDDVAQAHRHLPPGEAQLRRDLQAEVERLSALPRDGDSYGLVHWDLNYSNYLVKEGRITLFDCAECCYSYFVADIAAAMMFYEAAYFRPDWQPRAEATFRAFMAGYNEQNRLQASWFEHLGSFLKLQNMLNVVFCYAEDVASGPYAWFVDLVRDIHREGHPPYDLDFRALYESLAG